MSEKKPTTVQVTKTPILVAHKDAIRHNVIEFFTHCGNEDAAKIMIAALNFDKERGGKSKSSTALISDAIEGRDDALLLYLDNLVKRFREFAKKHVMSKYRILDAVTGKEKDGKYFVLKVDAKDAQERMAVFYALRAYADAQTEIGNKTFADSVNDFNNGFKPKDYFIRVTCDNAFSKKEKDDMVEALKEVACGQFFQRRRFYNETLKANDDYRTENRRLENSVNKLRRVLTVLVPVATLGPLVTAFAFIILKAKGIW